MFTFRGPKHLLTSLKADQDINIGFAFSRCPNGIFPRRYCSNIDFGALNSIRRVGNE